jgi:hypothetical protein
MSSINRLPGWRPLLAGALASAALVSATSSPAFAGGSATTVAVSSGTLVASSASGGDNRLVVTQPVVIGGTRYYYVTETGSVGSTVVPGAGCSSVSATQVRCASSSVTVGYSISTGDGNDRVDLSSQLVGLKGTIVTGDGTDIIVPGRAADSISGGAGIDLVTYEHRTSAQPVTVTIDGFANDGGSGEGDNVRTDVEYVSGGAGNDSLTGSTGNNNLWGMAGNDTLVGNLGNDWLTSGDGNDTVWGSGGDDSLWGGSGDDDIRGHGGQDVLRGEGGNDALDGGSGNDNYDGGTGNDFLMAVGLGTDALTGGSQWDSTWRDSNDSLSDLTSDEDALGYQHIVSSFHSVSGSYSTGIDAVGEDLPDPAAEPEDVPNVTKKNYASSPLFGPAGPRKEDVDQGALGDCYFLARLGSLASTDPAYIRNSVAPLGDGSYAVRFWDNDFPHAAVYVRVDADLWTNSQNRPAYAGILPNRGAWVAIMEKAYAVARRDLVTYDSIDGGSGTKLVHVAVDGPSFKISNGILTKDTVREWWAQGEPAGTVADMVKAQNKTLLDWLHARRSENKAVGFGSVGTLSNTQPPLTSTNYRTSPHIMIIDHVNFDANGQPISVTIYNPWGILDNNAGPVQTISDPARIWYLISEGKVFRGYAGSLVGS